MNNPEIEFMETVRNTIPWLQARSVSGVMLTVGHIAFAINFAWMLVGFFGAKDRQGPTLLSGGA